MGFFKKIFNDDQSVCSSGLGVLLLSLHLGRFYFLDRLVNSIEKSGEMSCLFKFKKDIIKNFQNCGEITTSIQMYDGVKILPKYFNNNKITDEVLNSIACWDKRYNYQIILNQFKEMLKNRDKIEASNFTSDYKAKIYYNLFELLTAGIPFFDDTDFVSGNYRLKPSLEISFHIEFYSVPQVKTTLRKKLCIN
ncbi:MAG TPA: hypothetical protein PLB16_07990, partial [bacterium]|nr:hypothetical protein [bacterium]